MAKPTEPKRHNPPPYAPLSLAKVRVAFVSLWVGIALSGLSIFMYGPLQVIVLLLGMASIIYLVAFVFFKFKCPRCGSRLPLRLIAWNGVIRGYCPTCRWEAKYK